MNRLAVSRFLAASIALFGFAFYAIGAAIIVDYSSVSYVITEINANGSAWARELGYFGFLPLGILFGTFLWCAWPHAQVRGASLVGWILLWVQPVALVALAFASSAVEGSASRAFHGFQVFAYGTSGLALILLSLSPSLGGSPRYPRYCLRASGVAFSILFFTMLFPMPSLRLNLQRMADVCLAISLLLIAWRVLGHRAAERIEGKSDSQNNAQ